jgi:hypothetical protein
VYVAESLWASFMAAVLSDLYANLCGWGSCGMLVVLQHAWNSILSL